MWSLKIFDDIFIKQIHLFFFLYCRIRFDCKIPREPHLCHNVNYLRMIIIPVYTTESFARLTRCRYYKHPTKTRKLQAGAKKGETPVCSSLGKDIVLPARVINRRIVCAVGEAGTGCLDARENTLRATIVSPDPIKAALCVSHVMERDEKALWFSLPEGWCGEQQIVS